MPQLQGMRNAQRVDKSLENDNNRLSKMEGGVGEIAKSKRTGRGGRKVARW